MRAATALGGVRGSPGGGALGGGTPLQNSPSREGEVRGRVKGVPSPRPEGIRLASREGLEEGEGQLGKLL